MHFAASAAQSWRIRHQPSFRHTGLTAFPLASAFGTSASGAFRVGASASGASVSRMISRVNDQHVCIPLFAPPILFPLLARCRKNQLARTRRGQLEQDRHGRRDFRPVTRISVDHYRIMNSTSFLGREVGGATRTCYACIAHNYDQLMTRTWNSFVFSLSVTLRVTCETQNQCC